MCETRSMASAATAPVRESLSFPCLFLDGGQWERLGERLEDPFFRELHEGNLAVLEHVAEHGHGPWPRRPSGRRRRAARAPRRRERRGGSPRPLKDRLQRNVVAWYLTREEARLAAAVEALEASCRSEQWREPADSDMGGIRAAGLQTGELLYNVGFGYDALFPYLTDELKNLCTEALIEKGLRAYLDGIDLQDWWVRCDFNWNSALHGNAGLAALVIHDVDRGLSELVLERALEGLPHLIEAFYPGGGYIEGVMYLGTAVGHLTDFVVPYYRLTGDDLGLLSNQSFHDTISFWTAMRAGDGRCYNFSDAPERHRSVGPPQVFWWARMVGRPDWTWNHEHHAGAEGGRHPGLFRRVESFWFREPFQESIPPKEEKLRHFKALDWLTWRGKRTWLAFRSGFNGGNHDNDDLGNLILGIDRERFLVDPGYGATSASQHNCVTIRRHEQTDGATARAFDVRELDGGFYLACDIREAFPHVLAHYDRHLLLIDDLHLLLIDNILGRGAMRNDMRGHLQTRFPAEVTENGFRISGPTNTLRVVFLSDVANLKITEWEFDEPLNMLSWSDAYYRVHTVQPILLTFGDPDFTHELDEGGFALTLGGRRFAFRTRDGRLTFEPPTE